MDDPVFDWKVSKKAQIDPKNALELLKMAQIFSAENSKVLKN